MNKTVSTHTNAMDAYITKGRLEAEGIPAFIEDEHYIGANWTLSLALGGVKVKVPVSFVEQASAIIESLDIGNYEATSIADNAEIEAILCPECRSINTKRVGWVWKFYFFAMILFQFALPLPFSKHRYKCSACSHAWVANEERSYSTVVLALVVLIITAVFIFVFILLYYLVTQIS